MLQADMYHRYYNKPKTTSIIINYTVEIKIDKYPFAKEINPYLHQLILKESVYKDKGATMTDWSDLYSKYKEFKQVGDYATNLIKNFQKKPGVPTVLPNERFRLGLKNIWGQYYNEGDHQTVHNHTPHYWSFVYFVNTPSGSSPLILQDKNGWKTIKAEEGKIICFPAWIYHHVPPNKCKERSVVVGNLGYDFF